MLHWVHFLMLLLHIIKNFHVKILKSSLIFHVNLRFLESEFFINILILFLIFIMAFFLISFYFQYYYFVLLTITHVPHFLFLCLPLSPFILSPLPPGLCVHGLSIYAYIFFERSLPINHVIHDSLCHKILWLLV